MTPTELPDVEIRHRPDYPTPIPRGTVPPSNEERRRRVEEARARALDVMTEELIRSVQTLIEVRDNLDEKGAARITAAREIIDRLLGKTTERLEVSGGTDQTIRVEYGPHELAELRRQLLDVGALRLVENGNGNGDAA